MKKRLKKLMNKFQKNIVCVDFSYIEERDNGLPSFGKIIYVNNMEEAYKHQGYLLIYKNNKHMSLIDFDKKYRRKLKKYERIMLYDPEYTDSMAPEKYSHIELITSDTFLNLYDFLYDEYEEYKEMKKNPLKIKYTNKRLQNINMVKNYLKGKKEITTKEISKSLNMSCRNVERYMNDLNNFYYNIGYDYQKNTWYIIFKY